MPRHDYITCNVIICTHNTAQHTHTHTHTQMHSPLTHACENHRYLHRPRSIRMYTNIPSHTLDRMYVLICTQNTTHTHTTHIHLPLTHACENHRYLHRPRSIRMYTNMPSHTLNNMYVLICMHTQHTSTHPEHMHTKTTDTYTGLVASACIQTCHVITAVARTDGGKALTGLTSSRGALVLARTVNWMHMQMGLYPRTRTLRGLCYLHSDCVRVCAAAEAWYAVLQVMCVCMH
jgi:hypothetical protein